MNNYFLNVAKDLVKKLPNASNIYSTMSSFTKQFYRDNNVRPNSFKLHPISDNFVNIELNFPDFSSGNRKGLKSVKL